MVGGAPHYGGNYQAQRRKLLAAARADPLAICWRDGLTLAQHPPHHDGTRPTWTAGHTVDGVAGSPAWLDVRRKPPLGAWLAAEASTCNTSNGARRTNRHRANPQSRQWLTTSDPQRPPR